MSETGGGISTRKKGVIAVNAAAPAGASSSVQSGSLPVAASMPALAEAGADPSPIIVGDDSCVAPSSSVEDLHSRKLAAARAVAGKYREDQLSSLKSNSSRQRYSDLHSSSQVLLLEPSELWDT